MTTKTSDDEFDNDNDSDSGGFDFVGFVYEQFDNVKDGLLSVLDIVFSSDLQQSLFGINASEMRSKRENRKNKRKNRHRKNKHGSKGRHETVDTPFSQGF